ncbi:unnamed protein product [Boreogadus saida]
MQQGNLGGLDGGSLSVCGRSRRVPPPPPPPPVWVTDAGPVKISLIGDGPPSSITKGGGADLAAEMERHEEIPCGGVVCPGLRWALTEAEAPFQNINNTRSSSAFSVELRAHRPLRALSLSNDTPEGAVALTGGLAGLLAPSLTHSPHLPGLPPGGPRRVVRGRSTAHANHAIANEILQDRYAQRSSPFPVDERLPQGVTPGAARTAFTSSGTQWENEASPGTWVPSCSGDVITMRRSPVSAMRERAMMSLLPCVWRRAVACVRAVACAWRRACGGVCVEACARWRACAAGVGPASCPPLADKGADNKAAGRAGRWSRPRPRPAACDGRGEEPS